MIEGRIALDRSRLRDDGYLGRMLADRREMTIPDYGDLMDALAARLSAASAMTRAVDMHLAQMSVGR